MYTYNFEGRRYDVGDKLGFLQVTVEQALRKAEFKNEFIKYLEDILKNKNVNNKKVKSYKTKTLLQLINLQ